MRERILIVDDCDVNVEILKELLKDQYELAEAASGEECLEKVRDFSPDLVLLDIMMPGINGYDACRRIKESPVGSFTQVILVSGKATAAERVHGYEAGADDYIVKPFDHDELLAKVRVQFRLRQTMNQLWSADAKIRQFNADLERIVDERTEEVVEIRDLMIFSLAKLAESRDPETGAHLERMRSYSRILAERLAQEGPYAAQITPSFIQDIYRSSPLHDIGKVGIPDAILLKPGRLTAEEFEVMKRHTVIGSETMAQAAGLSTHAEFLAIAIDIARHHHERFDGSGYPDGLAGTDIPLAARIVGLADVYDALTSRRIYKEALSPAKARAIIDEGNGSHFDPVVVEAFHACFPAFLSAQRETEFTAMPLVASSSSVEHMR